MEIKLTAEEANELETIIWLGCSTMGVDAYDKTEPLRAKISTWIKEARESKEEE